MDRYQMLAQELGEKGPRMVCTFCGGPRAGEKVWWDPGAPAPQGLAGTGAPGFYTAEDGQIVFCEHLCLPPHIIICGGGHVGRKTAVMAALCGFAVTVLDDRPEFLRPADFPQGARLICAPFEEGLAPLGGKECWFVVVTRGHAADLACVRAILSKEHAYLGMIGSKAKVAHTMEVLRAEGVPPEKCEGIRAPNGLDLGGGEPAEIAVSILAQIIQEKSRASAAQVPPEVLWLWAGGPRPAVAVTVVQKKGSAPRGPGARMVCGPGKDGFCILAGTVGGGSVEAAALRRAEQFFHSKEPVALAHYDLSGAEASGLGMVCGGDMTLLFEKMG